MGEITGSGGVVHVACCFDTHMEIPFLTVADTIRRHQNGSRKVLLHAFHTDPLAQDPAFVDALVSDTFEVRFTHIRPQFDRVAGQLHVTPTMYCRLMLPELLTDVDRVVYLDIDVIVLRDLAALYDADLAGCALGAVIDYSLVGLCPLNDWRVDTADRSWTIQDYNREVVGLTDWQHYFNSGVLVMDLARFRAKGFARAATEFIERTWSTRLFNDQDALNHVLDGAFARLDPRWNVHANRRPENFRGADEHLSKVGELWQRDPWILHYCGPSKPWLPHIERTVWDDRFWREAVQGPAFPLMAKRYLDQCKQMQLTSLCSAKRLFATGKPKLEVGDVLAHARKFADIPVASSISVAIAAMLDRDAEPPEGCAIVRPGQFRTRSGVPAGDAIDFDLAAADGHIVYGPYATYPPGTYRASFDLSITGVDPGRGWLCLEVVGDRDRFLAQRPLTRLADITDGDCALDFATAGDETFIEFRISAAGFPRGRLQFGGVKLQIIE